MDHPKHSIDNVFVYIHMYKWGDVWECTAYFSYKEFQGKTNHHTGTCSKVYVDNDVDNDIISMNHPDVL